jgi:hypothetical protein
VTERNNTVSKNNFYNFKGHHHKRGIKPVSAPSQQFNQLFLAPTANQLFLDELALTIHAAMGAYFADF